MGRRLDTEVFEQAIYRTITRGNDTLDLMAQSLKVGRSVVSFRIKIMVAEGKLMCKTVDKVNYYSRGEYRAHDPFFLCPPPKGDLNGCPRQSHAAP